MARVVNSTELVKQLYKVHQSLLKEFPQWKPLIVVCNNRIMAEVRRLPRIDAVEVVRCKDCAYCDPMVLRCKIDHPIYDVNDYCSRGVKLDGGK